MNKNDLISIIMEKISRRKNIYEAMQSDISELEQPLLSTMYAVTIAELDRVMSLVYAISVQYKLDEPKQEQKEKDKNHE